MQHIPLHVIQASWIAFAIYWIAATGSLSKMCRKETAGEPLRNAFMVFGAALMIAEIPYRGVLNRRFLPFEHWPYWLGAGLTVAGILFAFWARYHIGRYWSSSIALRSGHKIIRTGPYRTTRHPIYTGILLALLEGALAIGKYRAILGFAIMAAGFTVKAKKEEALLAGEFGPDFSEHQRQTGFFLPKLS